MHCGRILVQMSKVQYQWHINLHVQFIKKPCIRLYWQCCKRIYALQAGRKDRSNSSDVISLNLQGAPTLPWTSSVSDSTESRRRREVKWGWSSEMIWDLTIWFAKFFFSGSSWPGKHGHSGRTKKVFRHKASNRKGGFTSRRITAVLKARMMGGGHFVDEAREQADADRTMIVRCNHRDFSVII